MIDYWRNHLGKAERLILEALTEDYPRALAKDEVAPKAAQGIVEAAAIRLIARSSWCRAAAISVPVRTFDS